MPQTQQYCKGNFSHWDSKITTLPGSYLIATAAARVSHALMRMLRLALAPLAAATQLRLPDQACLLQACRHTSANLSKRLSSDHHVDTTAAADLQSIRNASVQRQARRNRLLVCTRAARIVSSCTRRTRCATAQVERSSDVSVQDTDSGCSLPALRTSNVACGMYVFVQTAYIIKRQWPSEPHHKLYIMV